MPRCTRPQGVSFWRGSLWIADTGNHRLRRADLDARELQTVGGPLRSPWDVAPYADDILVIAMAGTHQLWGYDPNYDRTGVVAGTGREGLVDGPAVQAELAQPSGLAPLGRLLGFVDAESSSLRVLAPGRARRRRGRDRDRHRALRVGRPGRLDRRGPAAAPHGHRRRSRRASSSPTRTTTACAACTWRPGPSRRSPAASPASATASAARRASSSRAASPGSATS